MENDKWVVKYDRNGKPIRWTPYEQYLAIEFLSDIRETTRIGPIMWGKPPIEDRDKIYKIAKGIYEEKYKEKLPISYLEYYNPNNKNNADIQGES